MISDEIERAKRREEIARFDAGERKLAAELNVPKVLLSPDAHSRVDVFAKWCASKQVRKCPAKPTTIAAFVLDRAGNGEPVQNIVALLTAIETLHDSHSLSNPVQTVAVRAALETIVKVDPPRSWPAEDKARFAMLDPADRFIIAQREAERDRALRQSQNRLADERKRLETVATEEPKECLSENVTTQ